VSCLDDDEIELLTRKRAIEIANVRDLTIGFSNKMTQTHAMCYWKEKPQVIRFNKRFIELNRTNNQVLDELIKHECIHLMPGCNRHNKKFVEQCKKHGIGLYGYSIDYKNSKPLFATHCNNCKNYKTYYAKPRLKYCKFCKSKLNVYDYSDKYGT